MATLKLGAHMSTVGGVSQALDRAASIGSNAVQVFTKNNRQWSGPPVDVEDVTRWKTQISELKIEAAVSHASYLINLASPDEEIRQKSIEAHKDELERAHVYGIPHVVLHPGSHTGSGEAAGIAQIARSINQIHTELPDCTDVLTLLELTAGQGSNLGFTFNQLRQMIEQIDAQDRMGVCIDTCHAFAAGYDLRTKSGYDAMMDEIEREIGWDRVKCWHFNDSKGDLGSRKDRHDHIGQGFIGLDGFRFILNDLLWDGIPMLLETPKEKDLQEDIDNLHRLCALVEDKSRIPNGLR